MSHEAISYLPGLLTVYAVCALGLLSPGPNVMSVIGTAMGGGRRKAVAMALGIGLGTGVWACATVAGLGAVMTHYAELMIVLRVAGGCYLLWLAVKALRSAIGPLKLAPAELRESSGPAAAFLRGLAIQMSNPKAALTWASLMSLVIRPDVPDWVTVAVVLGCTLLSAFGHSTYALAFSSMPVVTAYRRMRRAIEGALALFFGFAGIRLIMAR
jgi:threonine/homoserine/homoserine lactone efflux protein